METINSVAAAASKAIWGEQPNTTQGNETLGKEPVSGQQGKGTVDDPFDQGNSTNPLSAETHPTSNTISKTTENTDTDNTSSNTHNTLPDRTMNSNANNTFSGSSDNTFGDNTDNTRSHGSDPTGPHDSHLGNKADPRVDSDRYGSEGNTTTGGLTDNTRSSHSSNPLSSHTESNNPSSIPTNPHNAAAGGEIKPHEDTDKTGVVGGHSDPFKTSNEAATERSSNPGVVSGGAGHQKQQGADKPNEEPTSNSEKKDDAEDFLRTKDPNDHSGEPMHMHTGSGDKETDSTLPKSQEERRDSKVGNPGGQKHGKEQAEGTGEEWVKTSGMAVDGGDFDATKPGAGREADRLMELKGIHKTEPGQPSQPLPETKGHGSGSHGEKEKVPLTQKIKEKLHIGSSKDN